MRTLTLTVIGTILLVGSVASASARIDSLGAAPITPASQYPGAPKPVYDDGDVSPYAMNYADEAVQTLGFHDGHVDVFTARPSEDQSYLPAFSGGIGGDGAMLKLQWHPGE